MEVKKKEILTASFVVHLTAEEAKCLVVYLGELQEVGCLPRGSIAHNLLAFLGMAGAR